MYCITKYEIQLVHWTAKEIENDAYFSDTGNHHTLIIISCCTCLLIPLSEHRPSHGNILLICHRPDSTKMNMITALKNNVGISLLLSFEKPFNTYLKLFLCQSHFYALYLKFQNVHAVNHEVTGAAEILRKCIRFVRMWALVASFVFPRNPNLLMI